jgi:hypothetical protein
MARDLSGVCPLPIAAEIDRGRADHGLSHHGMRLLPIADPTKVLTPCGLPRVANEVGPGDVMMVSQFGATQTREVRFRYYVSTATTGLFGCRGASFTILTVDFRSGAMVEPDVICALRDKQAEVSGMIERLERQLVEHRAGLTHLEGVLRLFDPSIQSEAARPERHRRQRAWFRPGESLRLIYDVLRDAAQPVVTRELVDRVMTMKDITVADDRDRALIQKTLLASLHRAKETIERVTIEGVSGWRVI